MFLDNSIHQITNSVSPQNKKSTVKLQARGCLIIIFGYEFLLNIEDPTGTVKCKTAIKLLTFTLIFDLV